MTQDWVTVSGLRRVSEDRITCSTKVCSVSIPECAPEVQGMCPICARYLPGMCPLCARYLLGMCPLCARYLWGMCPLFAR